MRMNKICERCVIICFFGLISVTTITFSDSVILSYSMPVGQTTKDGKLSYKDTSYNGVVVNGFYKNGTGILTDGDFGRVKFTEKFKGERWVGWSSFLTKSQYIDIIFEFSAVQKLIDVTLSVHVDTKRGHAAFNQSQIFFSSTKDEFSGTSLFQCKTREYPKYLEDPYKKHVTLSLCENTARFIKLRLYFGGQWLLITEISFNSVLASNDETMKVCFGDATAAVCTATQLSSESLATTPIPGCKDCTTLSSLSNLQLTIIIVCVILLTVIVLLVVIFLLYRRRALCFGKMTQRNRIDKTVHVELHRVENLETGDMQNESSREPEAMQNNQEPGYSATGNEPEPYEEVQTSPPFVYAQLDKNRQNGTDTDTDPDYVIPANTNAEYEKVGKSKSVPAGYTELDNTKRVHDDSVFYQKLLIKEPGYSAAGNGTEPYEEVQTSPPSVYAQLDKNRQNETNEDTYQKLLKYDPDYVIPADTDAKNKMVAQIQSFPGYTELDNTKRVHADSVFYQKLIKK